MSLLRFVRWLLVLAIVLTCAASMPFLASSNLLPRRVSLHVVGLICLASTLWLRRGVATPIAFFALNALVTWALSAAPSNLAGLADDLSLLCVIASIYGARVKRSAVLRTLVVVSLVGAVWGLAEQWFDVDWYAATRPAGIFASRVTAATLVVSAIPLTCLVFSRSPRLLIVALSLEFTFIVSSRTRVSWVAGVVAILAAVVFAPHLRKAVSWSLVIAGGAVILLTPGPRLHWGSTRPYRDSAQAILRLDVGDRLDVWKETLRLIELRPFGYGPGNFERAFAASIERMPQSLAGMQIESPHNELLRSVFELGIQSLVPLLALVWSGFRRASTRTRLLQSSLAALAICSMTGKTLSDPPTALEGALVLGLILTSQRRVKLPAVATAIVLVPIFIVLDANAILSSLHFTEAKRAYARGDLRSAWEQVEPNLSGSSPLSDWLWTIDLMLEAGDQTRCIDLSNKVLSAYPEHPLLKQRLRECRH